MFRLKAHHIADIENQVRVPLTGTRSYLVTVSQNNTVISDVFSNGSKLDRSPVDWCSTLDKAPAIGHDIEPTESQDEFLEALPEAERNALEAEGGV